jgi:membrane protein YdbS with pleckstrin-like domain
VAWLGPGARPRVEYTVSAGAVGDGLAATASSSWVAWLSLALAVAAVLAAVTFLRLAPRRRRRMRRVSSRR